jgi:hypothetical protein
VEKNVASDLKARLRFQFVDQGSEGSDGQWHVLTAEIGPWPVTMTANPGPLIERFVDKPAPEPPSQAAMEVLSIVAYE